MLVLKERIKEILNERDISIKDFSKLAKLGKNTIYDFDKFNPSLKTAIKISNTLNLSLDFIAGKNDDDTYFLPKNNELKFYEKLENELEQQKISKNKFTKDLNFSSDAFSRWKNGAIPYFSNVILISDYLGIEIEELLGRK